MKKIILLLTTLVILLTFVSCDSQPVLETIQPIEVEGLLRETDGDLEYTYYDHVLDEKGQVIKRSVSGSDDAYDTFEYDEQGRVIKFSRFRYNHDDFWTYTYDENGHLAEECHDNKTTKYTYTLDDQGKILTKTAFGTNYKFPDVFSYTYYDSGLVATETYIFKNGTTKVITFTYDSKGRITNELCDMDGRRSSILSKSYTYGVVGSYIPIS